MELKMAYFLITSIETGKQYKRRKLKTEYKNIENAQIKKVYEIKRNIGYISNYKVYKTKRN